MKKIAVSACLLGNNCRYDGGNCFDERCVRLKEQYEVIPVCPECAAGLPTPREPIELVDDQVISRDGRNLTCQMKQGIEKTIRMLKDQQVDTVVLMDRSPSCSSTVIYDGTFSSTLIEGKGLFARRLEEEGLTLLSKESLNGC